MKAGKDDESKKGKDSSCNTHAWTEVAKRFSHAKHMERVMNQEGGETEETSCRLAKESRKLLPSDTHYS